VKPQDSQLDRLLRVPIFNGLARTDVETLLPAARPRHFAKQTGIFREGDAGDALYVITSGEVKISRTLTTGDEIVFALLHDGDAFGELAVIDEDAVRSADATAVSDTWCLILHRRPVVEFLMTHPKAMWRVVLTLSTIIKRKDEGFVDLAVRDIPGRVARKLIELTAARHAHGTDAVEITISQATLAGLVGASRENVNRALSRFVDLGYIKVERGRIVVLHPDDLRRRGA
jgi:CRP/FNR family transcriptional regulator, cyclic AMP receptor protein